MLQTCKIPVLGQMNDLKEQVSYRMLAAALVIFLLIQPALAQSDSIEVDTGVLLTNINMWIPIMFAILALPAGIRIAMRVVNFIIDAFVDAFRR